MSQTIDELTSSASISLANPFPPVTDAACRTLTLGIVGLGYVGLPTALAFVAAGSRVIGYDTSEARRRAISAGEVDLLPRDLERLEALRGDDSFTVTGEATALRKADIVLVCVPTPVDHHLVPDLTALRSACETIVEQAVPGQLIMLTSTSFVGTTRQLVVEPLVRRGLVPGLDVHVAFSPERIDPANHDFPVELTPRVVGGVTERCTAAAVDFLRMTAPAVHRVSSPEAAEMTKLHENTFRAVNIAYANEMADVCRQLGLDVSEVISAASTKPYGFMAFRPGPGVGGHCIPCDPHYLLWQLRESRAEAPVVDTAMRAIAARPRRVVERVEHLLGATGKPVRDAKVLVLGVAYKPAVADVRESPALEVIERLNRAGAHVSFSDTLVEQVLVGTSPVRRVAQPWREDWDLVLVHTLHPGVDMDWLRHAPLVLDTTYRLGETLGCATL